MNARPSPYELYQQAGGGTPNYNPEEYHRLLVEAGHLVPRPPCTCSPPPAGGQEHQPACPRFNDNDRRLPCGWLPGEGQRR